MASSDSAVERAGIDAVALKPTEHDLARATDLAVETVAIDYEGREHLPDEGLLRDLAREKTVLLTTPVRADGFDPLGDDSLWDWVPDGVGRVLVAGHPAYLSEEEAARAIAPRLGAGMERAPDAWVGTEGVERLALATGATQYELLSKDTERTLRALRAAGFDGDLAVYAPTVLSEDENVVLDAIGDYVARRGAVRRAMPDGGHADANAEGRAREVLTSAVEDYALVGDAERVNDRASGLRGAGATTVLAYPARGIEELLE
ncbi:MAG: DUF7388 family protein [Halolamina sp.]